MYSIKKCSLVLMLVLWALVGRSQDSLKYNILLTGASFASSHNTWFEMGCEAMGAKAINRAIGGESIANTANRMIDGSLYSFEEFDNLDVFVIMQVHERDVYNSDSIIANYQDYTTPFDRSDYARIFDYVIKRYISDCYKLKDNQKSKYYGTKSGKPVVIILCTNWHDGRVKYNESVRKLAAKWGLPLVEFDKYIGFSKEQLHPVTGKQISLLYAKDTQKINGEEFGWHPNRGRDKYIQQRMAAIFKAKVETILPMNKQ